MRDNFKPPSRRFMCDELLLQGLITWSLFRGFPRWLRCYSHSLIIWKPACFHSFFALCLFLILLWDTSHSVYDEKRCKTRNHLGKFVRDASFSGKRFLVASFEVLSSCLLQRAFVLPPPEDSNVVSSWFQSSWHWNEINRARTSYDKTIWIGKDQQLGRASPCRIT